MRQKLEQNQKSPKRLEKMNIANVMLWMTKNSYEKTTIKKVGKLLRNLERNCDTSDPEDVKLHIGKRKVSNGHKQNLIEAYACFINSIGATWQQPFYPRYSKKRRAPKEELIDFIINHARIEMSVKLSMSKDLGTRPIELTWLRVKDIDLSTGIVSITGAKHTIGREGKLRTKSLELLKTYIIRKQLSSNDILFETTSENLGNNYRHCRNLLSKKYDRPELRQIQLYDFRRFSGSKAYHQTKSLLFVKQMLGHKHANQTEHYISLFDEASSTWIPVICKTKEEIEQAIKDDCILVCQADGLTYFKKPA